MSKYSGSTVLRNYIQIIQTLGKTLFDRLNVPWFEPLELRVSALYSIFCSLSGFVSIFFLSIAIFTPVFLILAHVS